MTVQAALAEASARLKSAGIDDAGRDARILMAHVLDIPMGRVTLCLRDDISPDEQQKLARLVARRAAREPVSKIIGVRQFWGRKFTVTPEVLDPRPETESLIAAALEGAPPARLLDLGTGSGILAITLLAEWHEARGMATDLSAAALEVAAGNAAATGVAARLDLVASDWLGAVTGQFDLIVSNPPYIATSEMPGLSPEVRNFDPEMALCDGADGLSAYRVILRDSPAHLTPGGRLMVEIGWTQGAAVSAMFHAAGFRDVRIVQDLDGRDRVIQGVLGG